MKYKWRNRTLERGVIIDRRRGYVYVRFKRHGVTRKELIGRTTDVEVIDKANFRAQHIRNARRASIPGFDPRKQRLLVEDAADLFLALHGQKRRSARGARQFGRYVRLIKQAWAGRYVDAMVGDDMRDYRESRRREGVSESTINREQTAVITLFNKLVEWRRSGQVPPNILLPAENPGKGAKKVNEDRFIRRRLLTNEEYRNLWASSDQQVRRIIVAAMNLPLRLGDLRQLNKKNIDYKSSQFIGVQTKTNWEYALPINAAMWELIRTAPTDEILNFSGFEKRWQRALRRAGLHGKGDRPIQFRDLRRTAATTLHDNGVPLRTISAMLGHRLVTTTIRYLGLKDENLTQAGDVLAATYLAPRKGGSDLRESVPESVPTVTENVVEQSHISR